jgi:RND superfamily putative drug exporter
VNQTLTKHIATPTLLRAFSWVAIIEACTWVALLGMYLKYVTQTTELGVRIFGSLHGAAFIAYVILTLLVARRQRWPIVWTTLLALAASIPPCMTAVFDLVARRRGMFAHAETSRTTPGERFDPHGQLVIETGP